MKAILFLLALCIPAGAEEGMWTLDNFPGKAVQQKYGFLPDSAWLDHVRLSSVRLANGCSASFVSPEGLVLTNHHCVRSCIQAISTRENDYSEKGFYARSGESEVRCPGFEANQLTEITDITQRVAKATAGLSGEAYKDARNAETARIEKECATTDSVRCDVVTLYNGGRYHLYKYRRFQDVRLAFAPESAIAHFGGDPDNFMFPRYCLDMSLLRVYQDNAPLKAAHYFRWSPSGAKSGELTFVTGHPGGTDRQLTLAELELQRDVTLPAQLIFLSELRGLLTQFQTRGPEQERISDSTLMSVENSFKSRKGLHQALVDRKLMTRKAEEEAQLRKRVAADPKMLKEIGDPWASIERAVERSRQLSTEFRVTAQLATSPLWGHARDLVRSAEERKKPNDKRLPEFAEARLPVLRQRLGSTAPIYPELETERLTFLLTKFREALGPDHPAVKTLLGKQSPREVAAAAVKGTNLLDSKVRMKIYEGGQAAVESSNDPMIELARKVDPDARAIRKQTEDEVDAVIEKAHEQIAKARFAYFGTSSYPDATFTLRISYGQMKGYMENGRMVDPVTIIGGAFERATGREPFALPQSWLDAKPRLDLSTPFNFVSTNDVIGGNSGSPVINRNAEIVGLIFDGNIHSLGGNYGYDESLNRSVSVHSEGMLEALRKIYKADRILKELGNGR